MSVCDTRDRGLTCSMSARYQVGKKLNHIINKDVKKIFLLLLCQMLETEKGECDGPKQAKLSTIHR